MTMPLTRRADRSTLSIAPPAPPAAALKWPVLACMAGLLACAAGRALTLLASSHNEEWLWLDGLLVLLAAVATVLGQAQRLPLQNIGIAAFLCAALGGAVQAVGAATGIPFGSLAYTTEAGPLAFGTVPWVLPLLWVVVILNGRSVARLVFRPWRKTRTYGFKVIGLTCVMATVFALGLEPYASRVNGYWLWQVGQSHWTWYGAPWVCFLAWLLTALLILAFATPFLINKKPTKSPPFYQPLVIWLTFNLVLACGVAAGHLRPALWLILGTTILTVSGALAGSRW
jgi:uncharacterized membrane protein